MKIVITTGIYPPQVGGPAQYALELSLALRNLGHDVVVKAYTHELKMPVLIRHAYFGLKSLIAIARADFVIALDTMSVGWPSVCVGRLVGTPVIIRTGGDFLWESYVERTGDMVLLRQFYVDGAGQGRGFDMVNFLTKLTAKERIIFKLTRFTLAHASRLVFSTEWQRSIWSNPYQLDVSKTSIIENFYPGANNTDSKTRAHPVGDHKVRIVAATRPLKWKNIDMLHRVIERINAKNGNENIVLETNILPYKENLERLRQADLVVLVSLGDISPNMVIDALSVGCPCILTKENGISDRVSAFVAEVDPLDEGGIEAAIRRMLTNVEQEKFRSQITEFDFKHSWAQIASEFIDVSSGSPHRMDSKPIPVGVIFSSDFNMLDTGSPVFKRHEQYARKYRTLFVGLIGRIPKISNLPTWSSHNGRQDGEVGPWRLVVFRSKYGTPVLQFLDVVYMVRDKIRYFIYTEHAITNDPYNRVVEIICQDPFFTGLAGVLLKRNIIGKVSTVTLEMQLHADVTSPWYTRQSLANRIRLLMAGYMLERADNIRVVSNRIKSGIISKWNIDANKITVSPINIDADRYKNVVINIDLHKKYPQWDKIVLMASRLEPEKDIYTAIKIWSLVLNKAVGNSSVNGSKWGLVIVGRGSRLAGLKALVGSLKINGNVAFEDWTDQMPSYYRTADLFLLTSLHEGYSMTLVEASLAGTPIVTTDVGIANELKEDKNNKITVVGVRDVKSTVEAVYNSLV